MKVKHNKKRNTAFVYEALINEATIAVLKNDHKRSKKVVDLVRKHFSNDSNLKRDLECYILYENQNLDLDMIKRFKRSKHFKTDWPYFDEQTDIINDVKIYPLQYLTILYQIINRYYQQMFNTTSPKEKVILESKIIENMSASPESNDEHPLLIILFIKFCWQVQSKISRWFTRRAKIYCHISSFTDNSIELKIS